MRPLTEIQAELDQLKAKEQEYYDGIDEVQAQIAKLQEEKRNACFWIRQNAPSLEYYEKIKEGLTPEQAYNVTYGK